MTRGTALICPEYKKENADKHKLHGFENKRMRKNLVGGQISSKRFACGSSWLFSPKPYQHSAAGQLQSFLSVAKSSTKIARLKWFQRVAARPRRWQQRFQRIKTRLQFQPAMTATGFTGLQRLRFGNFRFSPITIPLVTCHRLAGWSMLCQLLISRPRIAATGSPGVR